MRSLFEGGHSMAEDYIFGFRYIWQALSGLSEHIFDIGTGLDDAEYRQAAEGVWISRDARVADTALICSPCIICGGSEIRHNALIRGSVIIGKDCVVGNSCEIKNSVLSDRCQIPHFNYVGDSILGYRVHFGAGSVTSNLKNDQSEVVVRIGDTRYYTGLRKLGAMVGDGVQLGCNVTLNPGTVIGRESRIYPNLSIRGYVPDHMICRTSFEYTEIRSKE